ncbi:MAG: EAL domain-containing protein [Caulobacterales bacterium]
MVAATLPLGAEPWTQEAGGPPVWRLRGDSLATRFGGIAGATALVSGLAVNAAAPLSRQVWNNDSLPLLACVALPALAYFAGQSFARRVMRPLKEIAEAAQSVSARNFTANLSVRTGDEIEALAMAFNRMVRRLEIGVGQMRRKGECDPVTALPLRTEFVSSIEKALASGSKGALIVCDLARFGQINEAAGKVAADKVLARTAKRIADILDNSGLIKGASFLTRLNADQFAIFAADINNSAEAAALMQALIEAMASPMLIEGQRFVQNASAGAVLCRSNESDAEKLIGRAQTALKRSRQDGANTGRIWSPSLDRRAGHSFAAEAAIRDAIAKQHIIPFFQPKVDLTSGKITSVEALARWIIPGRGVIEPSRFIPAAENLGLIGALGEAIMRQACEAAAEWRRNGLHCRVAVNVAPAQFDEPGFGAKVLAMLAQTGLPASYLELEITESTAMKNLDAALKQIAPLRKAGVRLSLDDFGAGHSSLAMLTQMPFDVFKIDRQFVAALETDEQAAAVVDTILSLGRSLNFEIVAEGIENVRQEAFLRKRGCTLGQGYLYGAPMPLGDFLDLAHKPARRALRAVS